MAATNTAPLQYFYIDATDQNLYDNPRNDVDRYAFINFMQHLRNPDRRVTRRGRGLSGTLVGDRPTGANVPELWSGRSGYWLRKAKADRHRRPPIDPVARPSPSVQVTQNQGPPSRPASTVSAAPPPAPDPTQGAAQPPAQAPTQGAAQPPAQVPVQAPARAPEAAEAQGESPETQIPMIELVRVFREEILPQLGPDIVQRIVGPAVQQIVPLAIEQIMQHVAPQLPQRVEQPSIQPTLQSAVQLDAQTQVQPREPPSEQRQSDAWPRSSSLGGELSHTLARYNPDGAFISPTRGQRRHIAKQVAVKRNRGKWRFARTIYQSSDLKATKTPYGTPCRSVWLFVQIDRGGYIKDHIAVKSWNTTEDEWRAKFENEIATYELISKTNCTHLLPYSGHSRRIRDYKINQDKDPRDEGYRSHYLYTAYCTSGDLRGFIEAQGSNEEPIPEHHIWYILKELIAGMQALHKGVCNKSVAKTGTNDGEGNEPGEGAGDEVAEAAHTADEPHPSLARRAEWRPLVHGDLNPANVFVGDNDPEYPFYRKPLLADFDFTWVEGESFIGGTSGYNGPEKAMRTDVPGYSLITKRADVRSDVFSLGVIALELMVSCETKLHKEVVRGFQKANDRWERNGLNSEEEINFHQRATGMPLKNPWTRIPEIYSLGLVRLVQRMLYISHNSRPKLDELETEILQNLARQERLLGDRIKEPENAAVEGLRVHYKSRYEALDEPFTRGKLFSPAKKRKFEGYANDFQNNRTPAQRRRALSQYEMVVNKWNNRAADRRSNAAALTAAWVLIEAVIKDELPRPGSGSDRNRLLRGCSIIRKRVNPNAAQDQFIEDLEDPQDFENDTESLVTCQEKLLFLHYLHSVLEDPAGPREKSIPRDTREVILQACEWGLWILEFGEQPLEPRIENGSKMHDAVLDVIWWLPSGLQWTPE
ncbi:kinase-like protein [Westerdykella ornata]|uniref:Kinase-like protein n=1 Tax=Westerdykella ornata TaxID=318751 RepID=A0A6A6JT58_WESOR|nr:kinase-like protein [Westerdykella ornata]KAF2279800.1 kinase-like protein [Westerdykella ornata]